MYQIEDFEFVVIFKWIYIHESNDDDIQKFNSQIDVSLSFIESILIIIRRNKLWITLNVEKFKQISEMLNIHIIYYLIQIKEHVKMTLSDVYILKNDTFRFQDDDILSVIIDISLIITQNINISLNISFYTLLILKQSLLMISLLNSMILQINMICLFKMK